MNPDELYAQIVKAIIDSPQLLIVKGDEAARHLHFAMIDRVRNRNCYFELAISHDGKESCIRFTIVNPEDWQQLAKATASAVRSIVKRLSPSMLHRSELE